MLSQTDFPMFSDFHLSTRATSDTTAVCAIADTEKGMGEVRGICGRSSFSGRTFLRVWELFLIDSHRGGGGDGGQDGFTDGGGGGDVKAAVSALGKQVPRRPSLPPSVRPRPSGVLYRFQGWEKKARNGNNNGEIPRLAFLPSFLPSSHSPADAVARD